MSIKSVFDSEINLISRLFLIILFTAALTSMDLITKQIVSNNLKNKPNVTVIKNFWYLTYVENDDIGLSVLSGITRDLDKNIKKQLMIILQGAGCFTVLLFFLFSKKIKYLIPLALILCGGLGNLTDRIIRGFVVDYIMWYFKFIPFRFFNPFPIFNLADIYASTGAVLLLFVLLLFSNQGKTA